MTLEARLILLGAGLLALVSCALVLWLFAIEAKGDAVASTDSPRNE